MQHHPRLPRTGRLAADRGASVVEYALIVVGVAAALVAVSFALKGSIGHSFNTQTAAIATGGGSTGGTGAVAPPNGPTGLTATADSGQLTVSWSTVPDATSYTVVGCGATTITVTGGATTATCTGLTNGQNYTVVVTANGPGGTSPSASVSATPHVSTPTNVTAVAQSPTSVKVSWNAVTGATGYTVTTSAGSCAVSGTTATCTGLAPGTSYIFSVVAKSGADTSVAATTTVSTPATTPGTPSTPTSTPGASATAGTGVINLDWNAPATDGGSPITNYTIGSVPALTGGAVCTVNVASTSAACTGLTSGTTYNFTVTAVNTVGNSTPTTAVTAIAPYTFTKPGATRNTTYTQAFTLPTGYTYNACIGVPAPSSCSYIANTLTAKTPNTGGSFTYTVAYTFKNAGPPAKPDITVYYVMSNP